MSYEGKMARTSLRKTIAYSTELLELIQPKDELEAWIQDKISSIDHNIEAIYSYHKFGEYSPNNIAPVSEHDEYDDDEMEESEEHYELEIGGYETNYFFMCPTAKKLYSVILALGISEKLAQQSAQLQDTLYYIEHMAVQSNLVTEEDLTIAKSLASNIMMLAEKMDLSKQHSYIQMHIEVITKVYEGESEDQAEEEKTEESNEDMIILMSE